MLRHVIILSINYAGHLPIEIDVSTIHGAESERERESNPPELPPKPKTGIIITQGN